MFSIFFENRRKELLEITHNPKYDVVEIVGLDPPEATLNMTKLAGTDGSIFNSSYVNNRQITITLVIHAPAEANRIKLYNWFRPKYPIKVYYKNGERNVYISGYVQSMEVQYFESKQTVQAVIDCPQPYFCSYYNDNQEFSSVVSMFEFPMDIPPAGIEFGVISIGTERVIINHGDVETGAIFKLHFTGNVDTPAIWNVETREYFTLNRTFIDGDEVVINTKIGEKNVTLRREGEESVIIGSLKEGSTWFRLQPGENLFTALANDGTHLMRCFVEIVDLFEGV